MLRLIATLSIVLALLPAQVAAAQGAAFCPPGVAPVFQFGFAELKQELGPVMGEPLECEHPNAANGDTLQRTSAGLAFYRQQTNTPTFTDGFRHWALTSRGLVFWTGEGVDPPAEALALASTGYEHPLVGPPAGDDAPWCLAANPSCGREEWWAEWNELQQGHRVQYSYLEPGLVTEFRYAEVVRLLWQWEEGRFLLQEAASHGVTMGTAGETALHQAFAGYLPALRVIGVNRAFTETSTWMLAAVVAHELKHVADHRAGVTDSPSFQDCIAREQAAYAVEARFLQWLAERFGGLPTPRVVADQLSNEDFQLYANLYQIATSADTNAMALEHYQVGCAL